MQKVKFKLRKEEKEKRRIAEILQKRGYSHIIIQRVVMNNNFSIAKIYVNNLINQENDKDLYLIDHTLKKSCLPFKYEIIFNAQQNS